MSKVEQIKNIFLNSINILKGFSCQKLFFDMLQRIKSCLTSFLEFFKNLVSFSSYIDLKNSRLSYDITNYDVIREFEKMLTQTWSYNLGNTYVNTSKSDQYKLDIEPNNFNEKYYS